jgi:translation elongation factor EF-1beta
MPEEFGLPTQQLLVLVAERAATVSNVCSVLSELDTVQQAEVDAATRHAKAQISGCARPGTICARG